MDNTNMWFSLAALHCCIILLSFSESTLSASVDYPKVDGTHFLEARLETLHHRSKRKIYLFDVHSRKKWPTTIPFHFQPQGFSLAERRIIRDVLNKDFAEKTCLSFQEYITPPTDRQFIYFRSDGDEATCSAYIGLVNDTISIKGQPIYLHDACFTLRGYLIFSVAATLGMHGEQQRTDRDEYIDIMYENIAPDRRHMYSTFSEWQSTTHEVPYDYGSAMHLAAKDSLASNSSSSISSRLISGVFSSLPKDRRYTRTLGQESEISFYDIQAINQAYCSDVVKECEPLNCENGGYIDPADCSRCVCPDGFANDLCQDVAEGSPNCAPSSGVINVLGGEVNCVNSPGYRPFAQINAYTYGDTCTWILRAPAGKRVEAWFDETMYLPSKGTGYTPCMHWVEIKDEGSGAVRGPRYCNFAPPIEEAGSELEQMEPPIESRPITSTENEMMVIFKAPEYRTSHPISYHIPLLIGFKLCYKAVNGILTTTRKPFPTATLPAVTPVFPPSDDAQDGARDVPTRMPDTTPTTTSEKNQQGVIGGQTQDDSDREDKILIIGSIVGGLLLLLILLVLLLIYCVWRRKKKQPTPPPTPATDVRVAYINPGYTSNATTIAEGVEIDIVKKKDPEDLDYSYVATPGALPLYEDSPPDYDEVGSKPMETYDQLPVREQDPIYQNSSNDAKKT